MTSCTTLSYTTQNSISSTESNDNEVSSSSLSNKIQYGPISVRLCRKPAPTIATGRRSKHLVLYADEAIKREQRREKNREAARKLKEKRQLIEEELDQKVRELQGEHSELKNCLQELQQKKQILQQEMDNLSIDPLDELLSNDNQDMLLLFEEHLDDSDFFNEPLERLLNFDLNTNSNSVKHN